ELERYFANRGCVRSEELRGHELQEARGQDAGLNEEHPDGLRLRASGRQEDVDLPPFARERSPDLAREPGELLQERRVVRGIVHGYGADLHLWNARPHLAHQVVGVVGAHRENERAIVSALALIEQAHDGAASLAPRDEEPLHGDHAYATRV